MAATRHFQRIISADSHVMEPYDLWWNALGERFGHRTPRVIDEYQGSQGKFFYSGNAGRPVARIRESDPETKATLSLTNPTPGQTPSLSNSPVWWGNRSTPS